ncbi:MAG TPA: FAD-binding oxidoreductase [Actinomycetota bacterium]|nr:FAD-binding oxidoreductase [Actinomycetota bacterium]
MKDYGSYGLWLDTVPGGIVPRPPLPGDRDADVAIVGGGYTGLWTAYYLKRADPGVRVAIVERDVCGFGASGRNGGWCSALFAASHDAIARRYGRDAAIALQRALFDTVDEVGRVTQREGIDAHFHKGGTLAAATAPAHAARLRAEVAHEGSWGFGDDDVRWLEADEASAIVRTSRCYGGAFTPHCAALHPARLARGLADVVERMGGDVYEQTEAVALEPGVIRTRSHSLRAGVVVRATEGYTPTLPRLRRVLVPLYSLMIATEPLPRSFWDDVGWSNRATFTDGRHLLIYAQRTADDRIAMGGRGAPYHFASSVTDAHDREPSVFRELQRVLVSLFPAAAGASITHEWGGPLGVPRDWFSSVGLDRARGLAWAGGYVGDGVATSNLAGRTLADLILGRDGALTGLPWVGHRSRRWEPEPLRWIGTNLALRAMASADRAEARTGRPSRRADLVGRLVGR